VPEKQTHKETVMLTSQLSLSKTLIGATKPSIQRHWPCCSFGWTRALLPEYQYLLTT